jgi:hypothetical protein
VVIRLPEGTGQPHLAEAIIQSKPDDVLATFLGGRQVHRR